MSGRIASGVLIMQDLFAVIFIAVSAGKVPSLWGGDCSILAANTRSPIFAVLGSRPVQNFAGTNL